MALVIIVAICFLLLFVVEVFLGGTLPAGEASERPARLGLGEFFGQTPPLSAAGIGLPMSARHPWAVCLVTVAVVLHVVFPAC